MRYVHDYAMSSGQVCSDAGTATCPQPSVLCGTDTSNLLNAGAASCTPAMFGRAADYGYVGGFYGNCSEYGMQRELLNGPIVAGVEVGPALLHYKEGVYVEVLIFHIFPVMPKM